MPRKEFVSLYIISLFKCLLHKYLAILYNAYILKSISDFVCAYAYICVCNKDNR